MAGHSGTEPSTRSTILHTAMTASCAAARASLPQLLSLRPSLVGNISTLSILGTEHRLPRFGDHASAAASLNLTTVATIASLAAAADQSHEWHGTAHQWRRTLQRALNAGALRILVLGISPTAGCRAGVDATTVACNGNCKARSNTCDVTASWSRHLHDLLGSFFSGAGSALWRGLGVTSSVHFKNAVDLSHFARCTSGFLEGMAEPHVIFLEGSAILGPHGTAHEEALAALRQAAPNARLVIVAWPKMATVSRMLNLSQVLHTLAPLTARFPDHVDADIARVRRAAELYSVDFLNGAHVLASLALERPHKREVSSATTTTAAALSGTTACPCTAHQHTIVRPPAGCSAIEMPPCYEALARLYALRGTDWIHPSRHGHVLLGALTAHFLARRLLGAACSLWNSDSADAGVAAHGGDGKGIGHGNGKDNAPGGGTERAGVDELCYPRAERIPLADAPLPVGWSLRDDSAEQSVAKTGFVSEQAGGKPMRLGPIMPPPSAASFDCLGLVLSLGFLVSWRPGQGALLVTCEGCACTRTKGLFAPQMTPFPFIETSTSALHFGNELAGRNVSVTYVTSFWAQWSRNTACYVNVAHELSKHEPLPHSKVRVDSLYVRRAEESAIAFARAEPSKTRSSTSSSTKLSAWKQWGDFAHKCEAAAARAASLPTTVNKS